MTDLREKNGRTNPWHVKFWGIGNEAWGCGGNMKAEYYANVYRQYATFMTNWNNSDRLYRIASGASDDDYHWTEVLMKDIPPICLMLWRFIIIPLLTGVKKALPLIFPKRNILRPCKRHCRWKNWLQTQ